MLVISSVHPALLLGLWKAQFLILKNKVSRETIKFVDLNAESWNTQFA